MGSWQFGSLFGGFDGAGEAEGLHEDSPLANAHNYDCNAAGGDPGTPVTLPPDAFGFCVGAATSAPVTGQIGDIPISGNSTYWPDFVTVQGPTLADVSPAPDWLGVKVGFPSFTFFPYEGDPDTGADICRMPTTLGDPYRCGPIVIRTPAVQFSLDTDFRTYSGYTNQYAEDGVYAGGPISETDPDTVETDDAASWPGAIGSTSGVLVDIVPPSIYLNAWVPDSSEPSAFAANANKLWSTADIIGSTYELGMGPGPWSGVSYAANSLAVFVNLYWELEAGGDAGSGLLMLVV